MNPLPLFNELQPWQHQQADGVVLRGRQFKAEGNAPTLFFSHGNGFSGGVYAEFLRRLVSPYGLITHDFENHGLSDVTGRFDGLGHLLRQTGEVFDAVAASDKPVLIGHSLGGAISTLLAAERAAQVRALILLDPILLPPLYWGLSHAATRLGRNPMANAARRRRTQWVDRDALVQRLKGRGVYAGWTDEAFDDFIDHATKIVPEGRALICPSSVEAAIFSRPIYPWPAVRKLTMPTLMLYGEGSYRFFPASVRRIAARSPKMQIEAVPGGHCFMQERPQAIADRVRAFLDALPT